MVSFKLPKESDAQKTARLAAIEQATLNAARVPLATAEKAVKVMALAERCVALGNLNAISDGASAAALARAALTSAGYNVRINVNGLSDRTAGDVLLSQLQVLEERALKLERDIHKSLTERGGITLS
jgi:formiminotetrahydrofolate cyclodeaminase